MRQPTDGAVANGDQKTLGRHRRVRKHVDNGFLQLDAIQVQRRKYARHGVHIAVHFGRFSQQNIHGHIDWSDGPHAPRFIGDDQLPLFGGDTDHGKRAALALAQGSKQRQRLGGDRQHVALLALVAPDFLGRHAAFFQGHGAQVEAGSTTRIVGQLGKRVGQAACAHVVDSQNRVAQTVGAGIPAQDPALVNYLLRAALHLGVAALY